MTVILFPAQQRSLLQGALRSQRVPEGRTPLLI
jgi:hypothetical protein